MYLWALNNIQTDTMRKIITSLNLICVLFAAVFTTSGLNAQNLTKVNFISVKTPQFVGSGSTRLPVVFRATVQSLTPNTTYRYYNQAAIYTDIGTTNPGAGNPMLIDADSSIYKYTTSPSLSTSANFETFKTDGSGSYTGWFGFVYTSNARFTAGNYVIPSIVLGTSGTVQFRYALNDSIKVMAFSTSPGANNATGIYGITGASFKNIIALYDNTSGTGRPLALTYLENIGVTVASSVQYYVDSVAGKSGRWGSIIPNNNPNGVRRLEEFSLLTGNSVNFSTDADGDWTSANTVNPAGGLTSPLRLDSASTLLPVEISYFSHTVSGNTVNLSWQTVWELNNSGFEIERSENGQQWIIAGYVRGNGTTSMASDYHFTDSGLRTGKYFYRLKQIDYNGNFEYHKLAQQVYITKPVKNEVNQNYPNPFNPVTNISFTLSEDSFVKLTIYDAAGREVTKLVNGNLAASYYNIQFDAANISSGVYFYRLESAGSSGVKFTKIMKMLLVK